LYLIDASSIIYAWDNYPITLFPCLWEWGAERIAAGDFTMAQCAYEECEKNRPGCHNWLKTNKIKRYDHRSLSIIKRSVAIRKLLKIDVNGYHADGVGENDIYIISTAKEYNCTLVSNENVQRSRLPTKESRYKIPAVCDRPEVAVTCISFLELLTTLMPNFASYMTEPIEEIDFELDEESSSEEEDDL